ncbi:MAG TPA: serine/threonine-protein kinase, partial [Labilithrix sp.]|nr:serine/threonine-protein kinase [Labilithrix sp.]
MALEPGQILDGKYRVGRLIGEGGMGTVYEGENSRIGRRVAIKVLHAQVAAMPEFVERFEREARAAARIGSQHVCDVLDLGDLPSGDRYIVMEYLDGVSFEDRLLAKGKLSAAQLAPIAFELLEGLGTMHLARVIHRDLKPANVFLARLASGRGETVKILDFGVAKLQPFEGEVGTMTQTGTMMGTPLYMSPEQARGARDVDGRTDLYAASVMFYRALAGVLPYTADTLNELLFKIVLEEPKALREVAPEIDEVFAAIVHKGLSRDLEQRFQTAREYQEAIAAWGKTQGRSSLSFSVTMPSEPPGPSSAPGDLPAIVAA